MSNSSDSRGNQQKPFWNLVASGDICIATISHDCYRRFVHFKLSVDGLYDTMEMEYILKNYGGGLDEIRRCDSGLFHFKEFGNLGLDCKHYF